MGVPFYGKYWQNVATELSAKGGLWAQPGAYGAEIAWRDIDTQFDLAKASYDQRAKTPFLYDANGRKFLTFDNPQSLTDKVGRGRGRGDLMIKRDETI